MFNEKFVNINSININPQSQGAEAQTKQFYSTKCMLLLTKKKKKRFKTYFQIAKPFLLIKLSNAFSACTLITKSLTKNI